MTPQQVWRTYPFRYIERYYLLSQRDMVRRAALQCGGDTTSIPWMLDDDACDIAAAFPGIDRPNFKGGAAHQTDAKPLVVQGARGRLRVS